MKEKIRTMLLQSPNITLPEAARALGRDPQGDKNFRIAYWQARALLLEELTGQTVWTILESMDHMEREKYMGHMVGNDNMDHIINMGHIDSSSSMDHMEREKYMGHTGMDHITPIRDMDHISNESHKDNMDHISESPFDHTVSSASDHTVSIYDF